MITKDDLKDWNEALYKEFKPQTVVDRWIADRSKKDEQSAKSEERHAADIKAERTARKEQKNDQE